jgi:hypothetical protein
VCWKCGTPLPNGWIGSCPKCGNKDLLEDPFRKEWDRNPRNPYAVTLSSGSATISSHFVMENYPETWEKFRVWTAESKSSEPLGTAEERVALLYSAETERFMEKVAAYVSTKLRYHVLTYARSTAHRSCVHYHFTID